MATPVPRYHGVPHERPRRARSTTRPVGYCAGRDYYRHAVAARIDRDGFVRSRLLVLEALLRLRQVACHPGLVDPRREQAPARGRHPGVLDRRPRRGEHRGASQPEAGRYRDVTRVAGVTATITLQAFSDVALSLPDVFA
jgi:hypothetical protein